MSLKLINIENYAENYNLQTSQIPSKYIPKISMEKSRNSMEICIQIFMDITKITSWKISMFTDWQVVDFNELTAGGLLWPAHACVYKLCHVRVPGAGGKIATERNLPYSNRSES